MNITSGPNVLIEFPLSHHILDKVLPLLLPQPGPQHRSDGLLDPGGHAAAVPAHVQRRALLQPEGDRVPRGELGR